MNPLVYSSSAIWFKNGVSFYPHSPWHAYLHDLLAIHVQERTTQSLQFYCC